ncbi:hypothetical protein [Lentzea californiensis]|uniref:hypothetical protein n=1 Tax=Lentzea californiensis TaxID=438851 RepID=UPI0021661837|nr:hypothetical protein [Lentzea californiensis]MCR3750471.1 hypothetical protein [Lentzea californiensis]
MISRLVVVGVDEQATAFSSGYDGVRAWHLADMRQMGRFEGVFPALAATVRQGVPIALVGCQDGAVRLWDPVEDRVVGVIPGPDGVDGSASSTSPTTGTARWP